MDEDRLPEDIEFDVGDTGRFILRQRVLERLVNYGKVQGAFMEAKDHDFSNLTSRLDFEGEKRETWTDGESARTSRKTNGDASWWR